MKSRKSFFLVLIILIGLSHQALAKSGLQSKASHLSLEHLPNGLTYCIAQSDPSCNSIIVKLAVRFEEKWDTERERKLALLLEKVLVNILEEKQQEYLVSKQIHVNQVKMLEPELFAIPNITLFKWELATPSQDQIDAILGFLSDSLEAMAILDEEIVEKRLLSVLAAYKSNPCKPKRMQPFYEEDEHYPAESLEGIGDLYPKISPSEIQAFFIDHYKPKNMLLFVTGNVSDFAIAGSIRDHFSYLVALENPNHSGFQTGEDIPTIHEVLFNHNFQFDVDTSYQLEKLIYDPETEIQRKICSDVIETEEAPKSFDRLLISEKDKKTLYKIVHTLGTSNVPKLLWKKRDLEKLGNSINHVHPMRFIATILLNPTLRADLQEVRRSFFKWNGFMDGFRRRMTEEFYKDNIQAYVLGFCDELEVKEEVVQHFVDRKDWEGLVKAILY